MFQKFMEKHKYTPLDTRYSFWCNQCDRNPVDSDKPETGSFFVIFGHIYDRETRQYNGEYTGTMFAVCSDCAKD